MVMLWINVMCRLRYLLCAGDWMVALHTFPAEKANFRSEGFLSLRSIMKRSTVFKSRTYCLESTSKSVRT